jgi:hypothetical protein
MMKFFDFVTCSSHSRHMVVTGLELCDDAARDMQNP